ncbi:MAG TPA: homocysteine S-methyltransferase family protein [Candidatus Marinimicrobia bacterium]|nr:homocysteine S-methyltransferase family protein [Candidatus Neomarinimicrobiota bacterium]
MAIWSADANLTHPEIVKEIHFEYIQAGAELITTNTFRTTTWTYRKAGYTPARARERAKDSLYKAVECAQSAAGETVKVAGSVTSLEDCYSPEKFPGKTAAEDIYGETTEWMVDAGLNFILFETMGNIQEITIALETAKGFDNEVWISLIMKNGDHILDGTPIQDVISLINGFEVDCLLNNCNQLDTTLRCIDHFENDWKGMWGTYPNLGKTDFENDYFDIIDESNFSAGMKSILMKDPGVIGVCCGSTPQHIRKIKTLIEKD